MTIKVNIPVIELPADPWRASRSESEKVVNAISRYGFLLVENHGMDWDLYDRAEDVTRRLMLNHTEEELLVYYHPEALVQVGYGPYGVEGAVDSTVFDLKRFWMLHSRRPTVHPDDHPFGDNIFPDALEPEFGPIMLELYDQLEGGIFRTLSCLEVVLDLPPGHLVNPCHRAETKLRPIYYPDLSTFRNAPRSAMRSSKHFDISHTTALPPARKPGLHLKVRDGNGLYEWAEVAMPTDGRPIFHNTGLPLRLDPLTNARARKMKINLYPTEHQVVNTPGDRVAIPLFAHWGNTRNADGEDEDKVLLFGRKMGAYRGKILRGLVKDPAFQTKYPEEHARYKRLGILA